MLKNKFIFPGKYFETKSLFKPGAAAVNLGDSSCGYGGGIFFQNLHNHGTGKRDRISCFRSRIYTDRFLFDDDSPSWRRDKKDIPLYADQGERRVNPATD